MIIRISRYTLLYGIQFNHSHPFIPLPLALGFGLGASSLYDLTNASTRLCSIGACIICWLGRVSVCMEVKIWVEGRMDKRG